MKFYWEKEIKQDSKKAKQTINQIERKTQKQEMRNFVLVMKIISTFEIRFRFFQF